MCVKVKWAEHRDLFLEHNSWAWLLQELTPSTSILVYWHGPVFQGWCSYQVMLPCRPSTITLRPSPWPCSVCKVWQFLPICVWFHCFAPSPPYLQHFTSPFFYLVTHPVSLLLGLLNKIISVHHFLLQPFALFEFISQSNSPLTIFPLLSLSFFNHSSTSFLPGLCHPPPPYHPALSPLF